MLGHASGVVTVNDAPIKSKLYRFCEKKIDKWVEGHAPLVDALDDSLADTAVDFKVMFTEEEETRQISCETEIRLGQHVFRGADLGSDTQQAFMQCLKRLHSH